MTGDETLMGGYGVDLLGEKIQFKPNTRYQCTGFTKSAGPAMKVFIKGYANVRRRVDGEMKTFEDQVYQMRKDIAPTDDWTAFTLDFEIIPTNVFSDHEHRIEYLRVKLWAFWPAGTCWFDDIRMVEVAPVSPADRRADDAVTHMDIPPRLGPQAKTVTTRPADDIWLDAVNAFTADRYAEAWTLLQPLLADDPENCDYRVMAARLLAALGTLDVADEHASWLLDQAQSDQVDTRPQTWQLEWARLIHAQVLCVQGDTEGGVSELRSLNKAATSPHVRKEARRLLSVLDSSRETP
ncbi:MAG: hypothetical protein JXO22_00100 [Phycisphaerae bacterium]|nr:hypothetical protein [Phycisphaerae bacterium]